jgi:hypothetical protein
MKHVITYVGIDAHQKDLFLAMLVGNLSLSRSRSGDAQDGLNGVEHQDRRDCPWRVLSTTACSTVVTPRRGRSGDAAR